MKIKGSMCATLYPDKMFVDLEKYEELQKQNAEVKNKIEELKCCGNCSHEKGSWAYCSDCEESKNNKWEPKEKK